MSRQTIVAGIDVSRTWSGDEILALHARGKLRDITLEGYCTRAEADESGKVVLRFVPFYESTWFREEQQQGGERTRPGDERHGERADDE